MLIDIQLCRKSEMPNQVKLVYDENQFEKDEDIYFD